MVLYIYIEIQQNDQTMSSYPLINTLDQQRTKQKTKETHATLKRETHAKIIIITQKGRDEYQLTQIEKLIG